MPSRFQFPDAHLYYGREEWLHNPDPFDQKIHFDRDETGNHQSTHFAADKRDDQKNHFSIFGRCDDPMYGLSLFSRDTPFVSGSCKSSQK